MKYQSVVQAANKGRWQQWDHTIISQLYREGMSLSQIGKKVGKDSNTVRYWLKKYGISRRTISEARVLNWRDPEFRAKVVATMNERRKTWDYSAIGRKISTTRLGVQVSFRIGKSRSKFHDLLITYAIAFPKLLGYSNVYLRQTKDFDLIGIKLDGTRDTIEVEVAAADFTHAHHDITKCNKLLTYHGTRLQLQIPPMLPYDKQHFLQFINEVLRPV